MGDSLKAKGLGVGGALGEARLLELLAKPLALGGEGLPRDSEVKDRLGSAGNTPVRETVAVQVGEDRLGHLERPVLGLDEGAAQRVDVVGSPEALVPDDGRLPVLVLERIEVVIDADLLEDVRIRGVGTLFGLYATHLTTARAVEGLGVVHEEDPLVEIFALRVLAVANGSSQHVHTPLHGLTHGVSSSRGSVD